MTNKEVYNYFEQLHAYIFSTIEDGYPVSRVAHFNTYDDDGLYFMTMKVKPFYKQLKETGRVSVCALIANQEIASHDENGLPGFPPGYFVRVSGEIREVSTEELMEKAKENNRFKAMVKDLERYPTMITFVLHRYKGEVYDYDFELTSRDHKIIRERFDFGGMEVEPSGFTIDSEKCITCGQCFKVCSFKAIVPGENFYSINALRCDECGSCYVVCPVNAVTAKSPLEEEERKIIGKQTLAYYSK